MGEIAVRAVEIAQGRGLHEDVRRGAEDTAHPAPPRGWRVRAVTGVGLRHHAPPLPVTALHVRLTMPFAVPDVAAVSNARFRTNVSLACVVWKPSRKILHLAMVWWLSALPVVAGPGPRGIDGPGADHVAVSRRRRTRA